MENNRNIEEMIADARAEEEVAREQQEKAADKRFREQLREQLKDVLNTKAESEKVTISLDEFLTLSLKAKDLDRLLNAIVSEAKLSYNKKYLTTDGETVVNTFKVLYPEAYDHLLEVELMQDKDGDE